MRSQSTSKLTKTMLSQLQENEYLRIKLIQIEKVCREKDNFYLSIFREQQKVTQKVISQLFLTEQKIKSLIKSRICNNWKDEYDTLATSITIYVKDVNSLIQEYRKTKQKLQQKAYSSNELYDYYSNTLEECGRKFDQAQVIIEELNGNIGELKQTVRELDQELGDKIAIIESQNQEIQALRYEVQQSVDIQDLTRAHQSDIKTIQSLKRSNKKLQKDNEALQRSIKQMQKLILELKKELNNQQSHNRELLQEIQRKDKIIRKGQEMGRVNQGLRREIQELVRRVEELSGKQKNFESGRKPQIEFITTFNPNSKPLQVQTSNTPPPYAQNLHQLHLKKILEQEQIIKNLSSQLTYATKNYERIQKQHLNLLQSQKLFLSREEQLKKQLQSVNFKFLQSQYNSKQKQDEVKDIQIYGQKCKQEIQDWKLQMQGLYEQISNHQRHIQQLQKQVQIRQQQLQYLRNQINQLESKTSFLEQNNQQMKDAKEEFQQRSRILQKEKQQAKEKFQSLLREYQQFVQENEEEKINVSQFKKESLKLCSGEVHQTIFTKMKQSIGQQDQKIKKKTLSIEIENAQNIKTSQNQKINEFAARSESTSLNQTKKFNLQSFQQKAKPFYSLTYSPKIGEIFDSMHNGRKIPPSRW